VKCSGCGFDNVAGMKFCGECGGALALKCRSCGFENPRGMKFCGECGKPLSEASKPGPSPDPRSYTPKHLAEKILTSRSALEGERKHVTVLFADVKESMNLASRLDPEEWHAVLDGFFRVLTDGIHRFEGTINQYTGDGVMALFGAPIAHEDHAARACYAALTLKSELRRYAEEVKRTRGLSFAVRIGIHSGEVVVGKIGDDLRMDYTAQGETVGLAARLEQLADPGSVYVSERTAALVRGYFALRDLGTFTVKGLPAPARIYELEGAGRLRTRIEVAEARGFSRFVGREREIEILESALERALGGNGQVVGIVADPGVGKSRLCLEFVARCRKRGLYVNEGHCPPHGKVVPYLPILELWRSYFGIGEKDSDEEARRKIAGTLLLLDESFRDSLPALFEFLGVPDANDPAPRIDPEAKQRQLLSFQRRLTHTLSEREPFVILIDDLHWVDRASDAFVAEFAEATDGRRVLFLANFRPEYQARWMRKTYYQQISLSPLSSAAVEELLDDLLGTDLSLGALRERIRGRSAGNPFFLEEVALSLIESGVLAGTRGRYRLTRPIDTVGIPDTVHAVLAARIDRLSERDKAVLQAASVVGKSFPEPILRRVTSMPDLDLLASLGTLRQAEFVYEEAVDPETVYAFKHPLTQEVAYKTQLVERRKQAHAAVARAIEELYPDKLDERAALVGHHWETADDLLQAARWHRRAAEWAGAHAPLEAMRHWRKVRELASEAPASDEALTLGIAACGQIINFGWRAELSTADAEKLFQEACALARQRGDQRSLGVLHWAMGTFVGVAGECRRQLELVTEAVRIANQSDDVGLRYAAHSGLMYAYYVAGLVKKAYELNDVMLRAPPNDPRIGAEIMGYAPYLELRAMQGHFSAYLFDLNTAELALRDAGELAKVHRGDVEFVAVTSFLRADVAALRGDGAAAVALAREALETGGRIGASYLRVHARVFVARAHLVRGEWGEARRYAEDGLAIAHERRSGLDHEALLLAILAEAELGAGEPERARRTASEAIETAERRGTSLQELFARLALAKVLLAAGDASEAEAIASQLERALTLVERTGARTLKPFIGVEFARLARLRGDEMKRERELREAHRLFLEIGAPIRAEQVAKELDR
jgi:class 3 adenylate cyclase/tetratricopeptide (TPR) repeat protein